MLVYNDFRDIPHPSRVRLSFNKNKTPLPLAACEEGSEITFSLNLSRVLGASNVRLSVYDDDTCKETILPMKFEDSDRLNDSFSITVKSEVLTAGDGLLYFNMRFLSYYGELSVSGNWSVKEPTLTDDISSASRYQLTVYRRGGVKNTAMAGGVMYQIMVDRFCRGGGKYISSRNDVVMCEDWYDDVSQYPAYPGAPLKNNLFYGGNLDGVTEKLDYLSSLSVDTLYLCPVFEAYSNHKYDTGDYMKVDSMFGGDEALERLIREARARNMRIILDGVFNHTGNISRYFNADGRYDSVGASESKDSPYYDWYDFKRYPDEYRCWWGVRVLPAVKGNSESFQNFIAGQNGVVDKYSKMGIGGFRLDVVDELNEFFLRKICSRAKDNDPDFIFIGEVWEDASNKIAYNSRRRYFRGGELDSVMNYPLKGALINFVKYGDAEKLESTVRELYAHYPREVSNSLMNLLGTHDTERILTVLSSTDRSGMSFDALYSFKLTDRERYEAKKRLKVAYTVLATLPGVPCIFYGDEAGLEGAQDPFNRKAYPWGREDVDLVSHFKNVGAVRIEHRDTYATGELRVLRAENGVFAFAREGTEDIFTVANCSNVDKTFKISAAVIDAVSGQKHIGEVSLAPMSAVILKELKNEKLSV